ncbi:MAG TPA: OsmC family protein [Streptosporangiales bacterium]
MSDAIVVEASRTGESSLEVSNGRASVTGAWDPEAGTWMPTELFLGGLASCMLANAMHHAHVNGIDVGGMSVRVTGETARRPTRFGHISVDLVVPDLADTHAEAIVRAASRCKVHNTLHDVPDIDVRIVRTSTGVDHPQLSTSTEKGGQR